MKKLLALLFISISQLLMLLSCQKDDCGGDSPRYKIFTEELSLSYGYFTSVFQVDEEPLIPFEWQFATFAIEVTETSRELITSLDQKTTLPFGAYACTPLGNEAGRIITAISVMANNDIAVNDFIFTEGTELISLFKFPYFLGVRIRQYDDIEELLENDYSYSDVQNLTSEGGTLYIQFRNAPDGVENTIFSFTITYDDGLSFNLESVPVTIK